ncbi:MULTISPECIES: Lrp/AsnC family transcriptional regulator [Qipengyuania]|uniref:Lrp/AsnC family transcriptional regulator n=1 Tax=Qipengyuania soli TaxID=2782568 RepID=A0A7S8F4D3_9SPHN|nr:Lrp/AsnC family transcriptional regulator [Qipengyuania soli]QPC98888.1 Lrp/AsnC family transcriptional regulator [Qipengyuania soli]
MDRADRKLLTALQEDSTRSLAELADLAALSPSACHRRVKALEQAGIISGYGARLDPARLGLSLVVSVEITLISQSSEAMAAFEAAVQDFDDILDCHLMSGAGDYLLRVAARDLEQFDRIHRECLSRLPGVSSMRSSFQIRSIKRWTGYPVARDL